jgi:hypothetical protein
VGRFVVLVARLKPDSRERAQELLANTPPLKSSRALRASSETRSSCQRPRSSSCSKARAARSRSERNSTIRSSRPPLATGSHSSTGRCITPPRRTSGNEREQADESQHLGLRPHRVRPLRRGARHPRGGLPGRVRTVDRGADGRASTTVRKGRGTRRRVTGRGACSARGFHRRAPAARRVTLRQWAGGCRLGLRGWRPPVALSGSQEGRHPPQGVSRAGHSAGTGRR